MLLCGNGKAGGKVLRSLVAVAIILSTVSVCGSVSGAKLNPAMPSNAFPDHPIILGQLALALEPEPEPKPEPELDSSASDEELQKVDFILDDVFERPFQNLTCPDKEKSRNIGKICLVQLAHTLDKNSSDVHECRIFQGEYDCVAKSVEGCEGGRKVREIFFESQMALLKDLNCMLHGGGDRQRQRGDVRPAVLLRRGGLRAKNKIETTTRVNHVLKSSKNKHDRDGEVSDGNVAFYAITTAASFLFVFLPQAVLQAMGK